jgi:O-antigen/teichoic acid export membrane protein
MTQAGTLVAHAAIIRAIAPGVTLRPSLSLRGLGEISGFSVFSFLTYGFHMMQRESAKLILGSTLGPAPVAYLGTPDNVAQRIHMVVASGSETLMPRFSANRDLNVAKALFWNGTWASLVISLVFLLPLVVLMPDFLALWISPSFARDSATLGQLVALSYVSQGAYAPAATFFRGTGKPSRVTAVILVAGLTTVGASLVFIPRYGAVGAGYAYLLGSLPALVGVVDGWYYMFGRSSTRGLMRLVGLPLLMAAVAAGVMFGVRSWFESVGWLMLFALAACFTMTAVGLIFGADWAVGGPDAPSRQFVDKIGNSKRLMFLRLRTAR